ncbi:hypothetical protein PAECIP111892_01911 [Paenibacillus auburnensis]|uniref:Uncharacterized protein n=1 Tax=Paenibacillus auburnensis TaxID=2905649 RepID=A0ABN8FYJ3_9BACL|nr:hypothetical protein [Paenibacillus auburnensis]CAH1194893.1 hypothetical protein PAECIP111892_01911 [Paenibacillus auburnensis]
MFDPSPDSPVSFGYKCQWYAIRTADTASVAAFFNLNELQPANWQTGLAGAYQGYYFVSPPVNGWTLAVNSFMPDLNASGEDNPLERVKRLSSRYGEAYYFATHRVVDYHAWAKAVDGELIRAYSYVGESDEVLVDEGELTAEELDNGLIFAGYDNYEEDDANVEAGTIDEFSEEEYEELSVPGEDDVISMAELWTVSPFLEDEEYEPGVGIAGRAAR